MSPSVWILLLVAGALLVLGKKTQAASLVKGYGQMSVDTKGYNVQSWVPYLTPLCQAHIVPLSFATFSMGEESGGNPCAIGAPGATGPDGNPKELGIFQLYNPDDLKLLGTTGNEMRAFCVPGKIQVRDRRGNLVWTHRQDVARLLTDDEMKRQADLMIRKILSARSEAITWASKATVAWTEVELWRLVKLVHGLPGLVHGLVTATQVLGHPPSSWSEYRIKVLDGTIKLDSNTEAYRGEFAAIFDNAEAATQGMESNA